MPIPCSNHIKNTSPIGDEQSTIIPTTISLSYTTIGDSTLDVPQSHHTHDAASTSQSTTTAPSRYHTNTSSYQTPPYPPRTPQHRSTRPGQRSHAGHPATKTRPHQHPPRPPPSGSPCTADDRILNGPAVHGNVAVHSAVHGPTSGNRFRERLDPRSRSPPKPQDPAGTSMSRAVPLPTGLLPISTLDSTLQRGPLHTPSPPRVGRITWPSHTLHTQLQTQQSRRQRIPVHVRVPLRKLVG